jgi:polysaccharide biosynthesis transport protein
VDIRRLLRMARAWLPLMIVAAVVCGGIAYGVSRVQAKVYEAKATVMVGQALSASNPDYLQLQVAQNLSSTYAAIAKTRQNLDAVISRLGLPDTADTLQQRVEVDSPPGGTLLFITAQDSSADTAAAIANGLAEELIGSAPDIQGREAQFQESIDKDLEATQNQIDSTQQQAEELSSLSTRTPAQDDELSTLEGRLATLRGTYATLLSYSSGSATNLLTVVDPAVPPESAVLPRVALNTLLGVMFGLLAVLAVAFIAEQLDDSIKDPDEILRVTSLNTLGTIARMKTSRGRSEIYQLASVLYPSSSASEAYRKLRASLEFASVDEPIRSLLVTSAVSGEGKTVTAANLAVVFAQTGRNVVLIDADLRKPGVHQLFSLPNEEGLTSLLRDDSLRWDAVAHTTEVPTLRVLTTGPLPPNPAEIMGSHRMRTVLDRIKWGCDLMVLDSAPLMAVTDSAVLSSYIDGTVLIVDATRSRRGLVKLARENLARAGANVLGAVLNRVPTDSDLTYGTYYGSPVPAAPAGAPGRVPDATPAATRPPGAVATTTTVPSRTPRRRTRPLRKPNE